MSREVFLQAARVHAKAAANSVVGAVQLLGKGYYYGANSLEHAENEADLALAWLTLADQVPRPVPMSKLLGPSEDQVAPRIQEPTYEELRDELAKANAEIRRLRDLDDPDFTADDYLCKTCGESLEFACESCGAPGPDVIHELRRRLRDAKSVATLAITSIECINPTDPSGLVKDLQSRLEQIK